MVLARSLELCGGSIPAALGAYNTGHCNGSKVYAKRVLLEREELRKVAGVDEPQRAIANRGIKRERLTAKAPKNAKH